MINIGEYNELKIKREKDFGFYIGDESGDEVLLPKSNTEGMSLSEGEIVKVFVYRDSKDRPIATFKTPLATVGEIAYLKVVYQTKFGAFIDFGLDRDIFVPIKEQRFRLLTGNKYLFYIYLDKTGRLAATTDVEKYLEYASEAEALYKIGDEVTAQVYSRTESGTLNVAIDSKYRGLVVANEYFTEVFPGEEMKLRVKIVHEDGMIGLTPRKTRLNERDKLQEDILSYMIKNGGFMKLNDKSKPDDIKAIFKTSKNYFKMALGGLMKQGKIVQDSEGTRIK
ncbi:S1 RNA-binding domain-containing protein [Clostridium carnis]